MEIRIPDGFLVGEAEGEKSGLTVVVAKRGATGGCCVKGGAPGTRDTDLLSNDKAMQKINAVLLTGGSAYGLGAANGVMQALKEKGIGFKTAGKIIPIVPTAVIFDLNHKEDEIPNPEMAYSATQKAFLEKPKFGQHGVGKGATVGKIRGLKNASKGGVGAATVKTAGITVTAIVAVNAMGDVFDHKTGRQLAGAKNRAGGFIDTEQCILNGEIMKLLFGANTTIGCILTDAKLTKAEANRVAEIAHNGFAKTIRPVHTDFDGDSLFVMASGKKRALNRLIVDIAAVEAVAQAVENAVKSATEFTVRYDEFDEPSEEENVGAEEENVGAKEENIGAKEENVGAKEENVGAEEENVGAEEENVGAKEENVGAKEENVGAKEENIGAKEENIGAKEENIGAEEENIGAEEEFAQ